MSVQCRDEGLVFSQSPDSPLLKSLTSIMHLSPRIPSLLILPELREYLIMNDAFSQLSYDMAVIGHDESEKTPSC